MRCTMRFVVLAAVAAAVAACGDATTEPDGSRSLSKVAGDSQVAVVKTRVGVRPSVRVVDASDQPVVGAPVVFRIGAGGGFVFGLSVTADSLGIVTTVPTDSAGVATVGAWWLGEVAGWNTLEASIAGVASVVFTATGRAGPPAMLVKVAGDSQSAGAFDTVAIRPAVAIRDAFGNPDAGVSVVFAIVSGGGAVTGASAQTDLMGVARVGSWQLGKSPGVNELAASMEGFPPTIFAAIGDTHCTIGDAYAFGASERGTLRYDECRSASGEITDWYSASAATLTSLRVNMSAYDFSPHVSVFDADEALVASTPYHCGVPYDCGPTTSIRILLGAGAYRIGASGFTYDSNDDPVGGVGGDYTLSSAIVPEDVQSCNDDWIAVIVPGDAGVTTAQRIERSDCAESVQLSTYYSDDFQVYLFAGATYSIVMASNDFDPHLELRLGDSANVVASADGVAGGAPASFSFVRSVSDVYVIRAGTKSGGATGNYSLSVLP